MTHPNLTDAEVIQADAPETGIWHGVLAGTLVFVLPLVLWGLLS